MRAWTILLLSSLAALIAASAIAQNLYPNPDFNDSEGTAGWSADSGFVSFQDEDASGCPASGGLGAITAVSGPGSYTVSALGPCVTFAEPTFVDVRFVYRGTVGPGDVALVSVEAYAGPTCQGDPIAGFSSPVLSSTGWAILEGALTVEALGSVRVLAAASGPTDAFVELDEIRMTEIHEGLVTPAGYGGHLFLDDFDGGGVCRWSSSTG